MLDKIVSQSRFAAANAPAERDEALRMAREATQRFPLSRLTALNHVDLLQQAGDHEAAVAYLRQQLAISRSEPQYFASLAKSYAALNRRTLQHQATAEMYALLGAVPSAVDQLQLARKAGDADFYVLSEVDARLRQLSQQMKEQREELARQGRRQPEEERERRR
jgi:predicted Zn-dependent protease